MVVKMLHCKYRELVPARSPFERTFLLQLHAYVHLLLTTLGDYVLCFSDLALCIKELNQNKTHYWFV